MANRALRSFDFQRCGCKITRCDECSSAVGSTGGHKIRPRWQQLWAGVSGRWGLQSGESAAASHWRTHAPPLAFVTYRQARFLYRQELVLISPRVRCGRLPAVRVLTGTTIHRCLWVTYPPQLHGDAQAVHTDARASRTYPQRTLAYETRSSNYSAYPHVAAAGCAWALVGALLWTVLCCSSKGYR